MIRLRTLGECVVELDGEAYGPDSDALFAVLLYLSHERGKQISRSVLAELIWPQFGVERGRHCLRQLLYRIRTLGVAVEGRDSLYLADSFVRPTFSASPSAERLTAERMAGTFRVGPFLPGYFPRFSTPFSEWVDRTRAAVESRVRRVLLEVAHSHRLRGEWGDVDAIARDCLKLDPLNEEATFALAEASAMTGAKTEAISILDRYIEDIGPTGSDLRIPATVLRRRIAERFPTRRYAIPAESCFVGRSELLETLTTALLRARNGEGSAAMLVGPPGIGKTRVVQELARHASMQGVRLVRASCEESDAQRPMAVFADAVPQLRSLPGALGVSPDSLAFLSRLTEIQPVSAAVFDDPRDPQWTAGRIRQAVVDLADAVSGEAPILFVIEDAHWMDSASWAAVSALLEWIPTRRMLLLLTSRGPHPTVTTPQRVVEGLPVQVVQALDVQTAFVLVHAIATDHGGPVTHDVLRWCVDVGEGNPLFLRELAIHHLEGGRAHSIPPSLHGLFDARIARASPTARRVLQAATVLGELSTVDRLSRMLELRAHQLAGALDELAKAILLNDRILNVAPHHALVASRVYAGMGAPVTRFMHRRSAEVLEREAPMSTSPLVLWECAAHWALSGHPSRGLEVVLANAEHQLALGAINEALNFLEDPELLRELPSPDKRRSQRLLADCYLRNGNWNAARSVLSELASGIESRGHPDERATDALRLVEARWRSGMDRAEQIPELLQISCERSISPRIRLLAAQDAIAAADNVAKPDDAMRAWSSVGDLQRELGDELSWLRVALVFHIGFGDLQKGHETIKAILGRLDASDRTYASLTLRYNVAEAMSIIGRHEQAMAMLRHLLETANALHYRHLSSRSALRLANIALDIGQPAESRRYCEEAIGLAATLEDEGLARDITDLSARLFLIAGDVPNAARVSIANLYAITASSGASERMLRIAITTAVEVQLHQGGPLDHSLVDALRNVHESTKHKTGHDRTVRVLCRCLVRIGLSDEASSVLRDYLAGYRRGTPQLPSEMLELRALLVG